MAGITSYIVSISIDSCNLSPILHHGHATAGGIGTLWGQPHGFAKDMEHETAWIWLWENVERMLMLGAACHCKGFRICFFDSTLGLVDS